MPIKFMPTTTAEKTKKKETSKVKKSELLLDSLEIKGYRCFEHLTIEKLGRVNLIVGKNNVGKTALLEALWIYSEGSSWNKVLATMASILENRNERLINTVGPRRAKMPREYSETTIRGEEFRHLFFGRPLFEKSHLSIGLLKNENDANKSIHVAFVSEVPEVYSNNFRKKIFHKEISNLFVSSNGLDVQFLTEVWDEIILGNNEDNIVTSLTLIAPQIIDLNFIGYPKGSENRVPVVRVENINERIPLKSLGEGMSRLLGIAVALSHCKNGILIIDEIEIGLHYSVLPDVWKLIFKTARELNVQVFATTHSYDCIQAFAEAAIDDKESEGNLIRLARKDDKIKAFTFDEEELETITRERIEVR